MSKCPVSAPKVWPLLVVSLLSVCGFPLASAQRSDVRQTENLVLITVDGLRQQEFFGGIDEKLVGENQESLRSAYGRASAAARREALMPFFWKTLAPTGVVLGNRAVGSAVKVANPHWFSYPGYAELLTGQVVEEISSNDPVRIPRETVLEFVRRRLRLDAEGVASFATWSVFNFITAHREGAIFSNAGYQKLPSRLTTLGMQPWNDLQTELLTSYDNERHDAVTFHLALEYLKAHRPRLLYLALGETDTWAHSGRYDRVVQSIRQFDAYLETLWHTLQSASTYRDKTTLIITSDHGRGEGEAWKHHGNDIPGADYIWLAIIGPDTPDRGEISSAPTFYQKQIAATLLRFFGLEEKSFNPEAAPPIPLAFER